MISIRTEYEDLKKKLDEIQDPKTIQKLSKKMFQAALRGGVKAAKKSLSITASKKSGSLYRSIKGRLSRKDKAVGIIGPSGSFNFMKAYTLEQGITRKAKDSEYMSFKVNGRWVRKKTVNQYPRPWFERSVGKYLESNQLVSDMDKQLERDLKKIMES